MPVTQQQLAQIMRHASPAKLARFVEPLNRSMEAYAITGLRRAAAFIAQLAHESGEFNYMEEIWGPTEAQLRYEPPSQLAERLGNTLKGDGKLFKGRGPLQITGRGNYSRYGALLGVELVEQPELVATSEIGFKAAGLFWQKNGLNRYADANDFKAITKRINGGYNGLAERERFYQRALQVLASTFPASAAAGEEPDASGDLPRGAEMIWEKSPESDEPSGGKQRTARANGREANRTSERTFDVRRDTMDFRDRMFVPTLIEVPTHIPLGEYLNYEVPILDQGREGACTGYGLATVAHYLLRRRRVVPDSCQVSPRMLYDLARRYDEWPGEDYSGSSARGAMKGWHKHGICSEKIYPSASPDPKGMTKERTSDARNRPLGAYFRVNHKDLVAMHTALAEVGILYATCVVHEGWSKVGFDGVIELTEQVLGGHAFAIVAYDDDGFWIQNSWGATWGRNGFARIGYDDWLQNGTDVWVARLGAPVKLNEVESIAAAHAAAAGESIAYAFADLRPHIVSVDNDGALRAGGDYGSTIEGLRHIFEDDIPRVTQGWPKVRILLYAHGGLVDEASAVQRLADYRPDLLKGNVYPLAFIWRSDFWTTIKNILEDSMRRRRPEGALDATKDFLLDRLDDALEPVARALTGRLAWKEMKENALAASNTNCAGWHVVEHLKGIRHQAWLEGRDFEIHLVGHSAGSILHAGLIDRLVAGEVPIETCTLWAPACTTQLFKQHYLPAIKDGHIEKFNLFVLSDQAEQDDNCARIYNKSLLYLVSHAFEDRFRIPGFRKGEPILGMERWLDVDILALFKNKGQHQLVIAPNQEPVESGRASLARHHGEFDDDRHTVLSTFSSITGLAGRQVAFHRNNSSLRARRQEIDARTAVRGEF